MRRRSKDPEPTLFPFLSVLAAVMGTLILIIAGMSQIALENPKQRVEVEPFAPGKKQPIYIECRKDGVAIYPDDPLHGEPQHVERAAIGLPVGPWAAMLRRLQLDGGHYPLLLVRENGVRTFQMVQSSLLAHAVDMGYEPLFGDGGVQFHIKRREAPETQREQR